MTGLVMCRRGPERRPPGCDGATNCVARQTGEYPNSTLRLAGTPSGYRGSVTHRQPCCSSRTGRTMVAWAVSDSSATTLSNWR